MDSTVPTRKPAIAAASVVTAPGSAGVSGPARIRRSPARLAATAAARRRPMVQSEADDQARPTSAGPGARDLRARAHPAREPAQAAGNEKPASRQRPGGHRHGTPAVKGWTEGTVCPRAKRSFTTRILAGIAGSLMLLAGCSRSPGSPAASPAPHTSASPRPLTFVALGDSWPEGAHCGYCETFAGRYAAGLKTLAGRPVHFVDLTGSAQPFFHTAGGGTASLLRALRRDSSFARQVASGDVIMIATGPNEGSRAFEPYAHGHCGRAFACVRRLERFWLRNFDAILDDIDRLRGGRPTAIRLVSAADFLLSDPSATKGLPPDAMQFGAKYFAALNTAECDAARAHHAMCVDVRPVLNGPALDQPVDENSPKSMQAVADALLATGLPELKG
jgi:hypothetical protein